MRTAVPHQITNCHSAFEVWGGEGGGCCEVQQARYSVQAHLSDYNWTVEDQPADSVLLAVSDQMRPRPQDI